MSASALAERGMSSLRKGFGRLKVGKRGQTKAPSLAKTYTRTPLLNSHDGSWTTPLIVTLLMLNTESMFAAKMYKMDCASCSPGQALLGDVR